MGKLNQNEMIQLYYQVESIGKEKDITSDVWRHISKKFQISPNTAYKIYTETDWKSILENKNNPEVESESENKTKISEKVNILLEERKEKNIQKYELKKQNELLDKLATENIILEKITSAVSVVPEINISEIKYPEGHKFLTRPQEAVLCLSDLHIGLAVNPNEVGNLGRYNVDIYKKRLNNLIKKVTAITEHHRNNSKLDTLHIFALGDIVHGSNDAGQWGFLHTEINIMEQVFTGVQDLSKAILQLNQVYPNIKVYGVYGNHGRCAHREKEKRFVNWDYMIYHMMKMGLGQQKGISFEIPRSPFMVTEILGNKFLLTHGDQIKGWNGLPYYGMVRSETRFRTILERTKTIEELLREIEKEDISQEDKNGLLQYALTYAKSFDYMVMGHFHSMAELETNSGGKIILNSSFAGGDDYSINTLMSANSAAQKFFGVHAEGKSWTYDIQLDRE